MRIRLENIGKKFNSEWIFRKLDFSFDESTSTVILGRNGSGKSTLLQVISGNLSPDEGKISFTHLGNNIPEEEIFRYLALVAPYQELIEEFTLQEMLSFHFAFKKIIPGYSLSRANDLLGFSNVKTKQIRQFSSGMKQRVKLILALMSDVPLLLLDEPAMNLDQAGIEWYLRLIDEFRRDRTLIICSNQYQTESAFVSKKLQIEDYKS